MKEFYKFLLLIWKKSIYCYSTTFSFFLNLSYENFGHKLYIIQKLKNIDWQVQFYAVIVKFFTLDF